MKDSIKSFDFQCGSVDTKDRIDLMRKCLIYGDELAEGGHLIVVQPFQISKDNSNITKGIL